MRLPPRSAAHHEHAAHQDQRDAEHLEEPEIRGGRSKEAGAVYKQAGDELGGDDEGERLGETGTAGGQQDRGEYERPEKA